MKVDIHKSLLAIFASIMVATPAQAQIWTDINGTPLPFGQPMRITGELDISQFGYLGRIKCHVSMEGTVTSSNTIQVTHDTPGYLSNCDGDGLGGVVSYPFDFTAEYDQFSGTGKLASISQINFNEPFGLCSGYLDFTWYNYWNSRGVRNSNATLNPCVVHTGSWLKVSGGPTGDVHIN